jgi:hypothetical protein
MKRLLGFGMLALALSAVSAPRASAWTNVHFGVGLNFSYQGGNNTSLWGLWRNGPTGAEGSDWAFGPQAPFYKCLPPYGNHGMGYGPAAMGAPPVGEPGWTAPPPAPAKKDEKNEKKDGEQTGTGRATSFQAVAYPHTYYAAPSYPSTPAQPAYSYAPASYYTPPSYGWAGSYYQPQEYYQGW